MAHAHEEQANATPVRLAIEPLPRLPCLAMNSESIHPAGDEDDDEAPLADGAFEEELDLLVVLRLGNRGTGTAAEQAALDQLGDELAELVLDAGVGEYDGDESGGGECTMFFCGPDVDKMIEVLRPVLRRHRLAHGGHFVRLVTDSDGEHVRRREPI